MNRYFIDHDTDFDLYYVVQHAGTTKFGTVVHIAYTEKVARDWIQVTEHEEEAEFFAEFG